MPKKTEKRWVVVLVLKSFAFIAFGLVAALLERDCLALTCVVCAVVCYVGAILSEQIRNLTVTTEWDSQGGGE